MTQMHDLFSAPVLRKELALLCAAALRPSLKKQSFHSDRILTPLPFVFLMSACETLRIGGEAFL